MFKCISSQSVDRSLILYDKFKKGINLEIQKNKFYDCTNQKKECSILSELFNESVEVRFYKNRPNCFEFPIESIDQWKQPILIWKS